MKRKTQTLADSDDELNRLRRINTDLAEMNLSIRRTLEDVGFAVAVEEKGGCMKTSVVEQVKRLAEWAKQLERVRNALRDELRRIGYTDEQIRGLVNSDTA